MKAYVCKLAKLNKLGHWRTVRRVMDKGLAVRIMTIHELINANDHRTGSKWIPLGYVRP